MRFLGHYSYILLPISITILIFLVCLTVYAASQELYVADPVVGEVWQERQWGERNPFRDQRLDSVEIRELRDGWVRYRYHDILLESKITVFKRMYRHP